MQLTNLGPIVPRHVKQSSIANLPAHLGVERRPVENDINLVLFFAWQNSLNDCLSLQKIVSEEFCRLDFELAFLNADFFLLLCLARAITLLFHQLLELANVDGKSPFARQQLGKIQWKSVCIIESKGDFAAQPFLN